MKISRLLLLAFALFAPFVSAKPEPARPEQIAELKRNVERWKAMPQAERDRIKQSYRQFRQYKPDQTAAVQENFRKFRDLAPEKRRELSKKLKDLPPQQRERVAQRLRQLHQMGGDRRKMAIVFARMAKSLSTDDRRQLEQMSTPEEKRQFLGTKFREKVLGMYLEGKTPEERSAFEKLPQSDKKQQLQHFFRERVMRGPPGERGGPR